MTARLSTKIHTIFAEALAKTADALKTEGVRSAHGKDLLSTLTQKLGVEMRRYQSSALAILRSPSLALER